MNEQNIALLNIELAEVEELEGKIAPSGQWDPIIP
jgi:hypothetical protein